MATITTGNGSKKGQLQGWSDQSYYLAMRDGIRLAVSIYYPNRTCPSRPRPVLLVLTRYGRATAAIRKNARSIEPWLTVGYVAYVVDVRGTTSSFGSRRAELGHEEQQDVEEIISHLAAQPWCNGKVIATGTSYPGTAADLAATREAPALVAVIPRSADFNFWELFWPGGIHNDSFFRAWADIVYDIDFGRPFMVEGMVRYEQQNPSFDGRLRAEDCLELFPTLQPVDEDTADCLLLQKALQSREEGGKHWTADDYNRVSYRDDESTQGHSFFSSCGASQIPAIIQQGKPVQWWASWIDANTSDEAISRFLSAPDIPSVMIITANNHGGHERADPFMPDQSNPVPTLDQQSEERLRFADDVMNGRPPSRMIKYYVLGSASFRESSTWPPADTVDTCFWLGNDRKLVENDPVPGMIQYAIDPTTTTGRTNRWHQAGRPMYGDRQLEDEKLLCYDTAPLEYDVEISGWPVLILHMSVQTEDPAVFAYLEDVSPQGQVTYITEGLLKIIHRKVAPAHALPYVQGPAAHTFNRKDALPVAPGTKMEVSLKLFATAALIRREHRLRLSIAGADADTFKSAAPAPDQERFDIHHGGSEASMLTLPIRQIQTT